MFVNPYLFPPFSVISKCLQKIHLEQAHVLFIAPMWPTQSWFSKLKRMLTDVPILLPLGVLRLPFKKDCVHKQHKTLRLMACRLSGNCMFNEAFLNRLPTFSVHHGEIPQNFNIRAILKNGYVSVIVGKPVPFSMMK